MIKSMRMRWARYVVHMEEKGMHFGEKARRKETTRKT
jgi:hypothetical protein